LRSRSPSSSRTGRRSSPGPAWSATAAIRSRILLIALLIAGCGAEPEAEPKGDSAASGHCEQIRFEDSAFTACRYDSRAHEIALVLDEDGKSLRSFDRLEQALGPRADRLLFAMNAGMYDEEGMPIGLYVEEGRERHPISRKDGPGNFHMKPNGVFAIGPKNIVSIVPADKWPRPGAPARWATQSGPMLVIRGKLHPLIRPNGDSLNIRNGVGTADGRTAWFVISDEPVSFGRLARLFRDRLGCSDALYFDGAVSSLWDRPAGRRDSGHALGPMVAVMRRP
jgi:uncharacterized protein YigE (DUF2233 family)